MAEDDPKDTSEASVQFRYLKSGHFRVVHANGAWGGLNPQAEVHMVFWSERPSIPDAIVNAITEDGRLGKEIAIKGEGGTVRECEVDVVMNYATAKAVHGWLTTQLHQLEELIMEARKAQKTEVQPK